MTPRRHVPMRTAPAPPPPAPWSPPLAPWFPWPQALVGLPLAKASLAYGQRTRRSLRDTRPRDTKLEAKPRRTAREKLSLSLFFFFFPLPWPPPRRKSPGTTPREAGKTSIRVRARETPGRCPQGSRPVVDLTSPGCSGYRFSCSI